MTPASQTSELLESLAKAIKEQEESAAKYRKDADGLLQARLENNELRRTAARMADENKTLSEKLTQALRDVTLWKRATRYEQALKRPRKRIRHLPIFNEVKRAARREGPAWEQFNRLGFDPTNAERIFLRQWRKENKRFGADLLSVLLSEDPNGGAVQITQRDATVAATVIQWLGTNCGYAFLHECNRQIEASRKAHRANRGVA